tara:strand:+ start:81 stop:290 length:210 start_codon:yes stop_codon:yes gene_type:complete
MGTREGCLTVGNSDEKGKIPLQTYITTAEDLKEASELIVILDEMLQKNHANLKFEHLLLWWLANEPADS